MPELPFSVPVSAGILIAFVEANPDIPEWANEQDYERNIYFITYNPLTERYGWYIAVYKGLLMLRGVVEDTIAVNDLRRMSYLPTSLKVQLRKLTKQVAKDLGLRRCQL